MAQKKSPVFEYVNAVTLTKDTSGLSDPSFEKNYVPFIVNRALSYFQDSVLAANLMNERAWLDKRLQFLFLLNTLRPRKRFSKWLKHNVSEDARVVAEYYGCSLRQAIPLTNLHSSDQLTYMRQRTYKGGFASKGTGHDE
jgi:hypothetical protein